MRLFKIFVCLSVASFLNALGYSQDSDSAGEISGDICASSKDPASCADSMKKEKEAYDAMMREILTIVPVYEIHNAFGSTSVYIKVTSSGMYLNGFDAKTVGSDPKAYSIGVNSIFTAGDTAEAMNGSVTVGFDGPINWSSAPTKDFGGRTAVDASSIYDLQANLFMSADNTYYICRGVKFVKKGEAASRGCFQVSLEKTN